MFDTILRVSKVSTVESKTLPPQGAPASGRRWRRLRTLLIVPFAGLLLSGCTLPSFGVSKGATKSSVQVFHLWQWFSVGAAVIGALVILLVAYAVVRYRRKDDNAIPKQSQYHIPLEIIYTVVPIIIVIVLFVGTLIVENPEVANPHTDVVVNVNAFQWGWKFTYPGHSVVVVGQTTQNPVMVIPEGANVHINLTSTDVVHGFYVKEFNFSRFALPGVTNQFTLNAVQTGTFAGQCTQLCGLYHSLMFFKVKVVDRATYDQWLLANRNVSAAAAAASAIALQNNTYVPSKPTRSKAN